MIIRAHAKVNLGLNVLTRRGDGYHEVDTLMAQLALHDTLRLESTPHAVTLTLAEPSNPALKAVVPTDATNLAHRAATLYQDATSKAGGVAITLDKRIPVAAGLGGGSADAAAVLHGMATLYPDDVDLLTLAKTLGSDVPFFVHDVVAARARGRGEKLSPVALPTLYLVLVNPGVAVSAQVAYGNLQNYSGRLKLEALLGALATGAEPRYLNALQAGVLRLEPVIREALASLRGEALRGVLMSGSGATCFGLADDEAHAAQVASVLHAAHPTWWVHATHTA